jgi:hypothetical protein
MTELRENNPARVRITLSIGNPISIRELSESAGVSPEFVMSECQKLIDFHWRFYGTRAVGIEYSARNGYQLVASLKKLLLLLALVVLL